MKQAEQEPSGIAMDDRAAFHLSRRALLRGGIGAAGLSVVAGPDDTASALARSSRALVPQSLRTQTTNTDAVDVYPLPDTRTASPGTEISFRGATLDELGSVTVTGSGSGAHTGILVPHSDGRGVSYVPDAPFRAKETVTVQAGVPLGAATSDSYSFQIVQAVPFSKVQSTNDDEEPDAEPQSFRSRPDLQPLPIDVTTAESNTAPGFVFVGARFRHGQAGPMMLDNTGEPVWFLPLGGEVIQATDFRVQHYKGQPVLTWFEGVIGGGRGSGHYVIRDSAYREIATLRVGNGFTGGDLHNFDISPDDTALVCIYNRVRWDMTSVGGEEEDITMDGIVQEIDIPTGRVLFEWHSLDHIGLDESSVRVPSGERETFDYFHLNSIEIDDDGNLILSARNAFAAYKIDRGTGEVIWRLGGKKSSFAMGEGADFSYQHDARVHPNGQLSIFDNVTSSQHSGIASRGIVLELDTDAMTATLAQEFVHPTEITSVSQGNLQLLPNGNAFIGWGSAPVFSEFDANGELIFNGRFPRGITSYRAYRFPWVGQPEDDPAIAAEAGSGGEVTMYASWNGATEVDSWRVLAGPNPDNLQELDSAPRSGFETTITVQTGEPYVAIQAEDSSGKVLGRSPAIEPTA
jgi:hypothetical protein